MKHLLLLFVIVAFFATGEALKCYKCNSLTNSKCNDPFDKSAGVLEFDYTNPCVCLKATAVLGDETVISRDCINPGSATSITRASDASVVSIFAQFCDTDLCNGASSITAALSTLIILAMLSIFANWN